MSEGLPSRLIVSLLTASLFALGGCGANPEGSEYVNNTLKPMRTQCIGNYQVDLPAVFELASNELTLYFMERDGADHRTIGITVADVESTEQRLGDLVARRVRELDSRTHLGTGESMLVSQERSEDGTTLVTSYTSLELDTAFDHELHVLVDRHHVTLEARSFLTQPEVVVAELRDIAARLRPTTLVNQPLNGFCLGPVVVQSDHDHEVAQLQYRIPAGRHADLLFEAFFNSFPDPDGERLIRRARGGMGLLGLGRVPELRSGSVQLAGVDAEELLTAPDVDGRTAHAFSVETYPAQPTRRTPTIRLGLSTGEASGAEQQQESSLDNAGAIGLWDAITQSMTLR